MKQKKAAFKSEIVDQLDSLSEKNPGEYWKLYNKLNDLDKQHKDNPISAAEWFSHFSKLMMSAQQNQTTEMDKQMDEAISEKTDVFFNGFLYYSARGVLRYI